MYDNAKETNYMKTNSFIAWLTLITALTISGVAIFYSVSGLAAIFSAAVIPIIIMGGVLEVSKLVTAVWLHRYWGIATWWLKTYLSIAVLVLMLITSIGIFGFLSKAHDTASGNATEAIATVTRIDGQIAREENRIEILENRITGTSSGTGFDVTSSITQQETIRDGSWDRVQDDIDYAQGQIDRLRDQLAVLDRAVNDLRNRGVEVIETDAGGTFRRAETETIDYVAQADTLYEQQKEQRDSIDEDIDDQQSNIDSYRLQAQNTINSANAEINRLRQQSTSSQDDDLDQIDEWNLQIDGIYNTIDGLKDEKFESEQAVRLVESEVGPIRYIAEFFTGTEDADANLLESAVSWLIMVIIFVFDPLAVLLLIASQYTFEQRKKENPSLEKPEPPEDPDPQPLGGFEGFDTVPFGMDDNIEKDYELMKEDIDSTELESGFDFTKIQPSIDEVRNAFNEWEESQKLLDAASVEKNQVVEPVPEPISKDPTFLRQIEETKQAFKEYYGDNPQDTPDISQGVTYQKVEDSEYLVGPDGSIHQNALKMAHPELFLAKDSEGRQASTNFGTIFPSIAMKGDIFVRVDQMPNRVYKFEGKSWIEIDKATTDSYTFDEEYIEYIISQIKSGEYDIDLLSDSERIQVETYLTKNSG
jgi:hypothetical protein|tara:strand:- start:2384 stop:4321 length:1938 start_codon:yes stop_codon:yes gene_type:complete